MDITSSNKAIMKKYRGVIFAGTSFLIIASVILGGNLIKYFFNCDKNSAASNFIFNMTIVLPAIIISFTLSVLSIIKANTNKHKNNVIYIFTYLLALPSIVFGIFILMVLFGMFF